MMCQNMLISLTKKKLYDLDQTEMRFHKSKNGLNEHIFKAFVPGDGGTETISSIWDTFSLWELRE